MGVQLFTNNSSSTLLADINNSVTTLSVASGEGALFASPVNGDFQKITIDDGATVEIVEVIARTGDSFTVLRGQEGTTASAFTAGATVEARLTSAALDKFPQLDNGGDAKGSSAVNLQPSRSASDSVASASFAIALGHNTKSSGNYGMAIGVHAEAAASSSFALGTGAKSFAAKSVALNRNCYGYTLEESIHISGLPAFHAVGVWNIGGTGNFNTTLEGWIASECMDITGGLAWAASTAFEHDEVVKPSVANNYQYLRYDYDYDRNSDPTLASYTPSTTGGTEPVWVTGLSNSVSDGNGDWIAVPEDGGYIINLTAKMVIEEVMFVAFKCSGITAQGNISIGVTGDLTKIINNQPTVSMGADYDVTKWTPAEPVITDNIAISIDTRATGTQMMGRFFFKGFLLEHSTR